MLGRPRYETLDVFTDTPCGGNPLAVVYGAEDSSRVLAQDRAQFNYSETTFVLPPDELSAAAKVRIFTPSSELPLQATRPLARRVLWAGVRPLASRSATRPSCSYRVGSPVHGSPTAGGSWRRLCPSLSAASAMA